MPKYNTGIQCRICREIFRKSGALVESHDPREGIIEVCAKCLKKEGYAQERIVGAISC